MLFHVRRMDFQFLEDKVFTKMLIGFGKHLAVAGRCMWIKSLSTSQVIYDITPLVAPLEHFVPLRKLSVPFFGWAFSRFLETNVKLIGT